jgi:alpha-beta hydrolase superfamily lysophospholipase
MQTKEGWLTAQDGMKIFWKAFLRDAAPRAVVHVIHGYAEHIDRD